LEVCLAPKKILIVDDEPDITLTLGKGLEQGGYNVHVFNDAKEANLMAIVHHTVA
jgi:DNA-binding response OmpR family regulator